jgi:hypothetical protein
MLAQCKTLADANDELVSVSTFAGGCALTNRRMTHAGPPGQARRRDEAASAIAMRRLRKSSQNTSSPVKSGFCRD